jgi:hypothetical protein
MAPAHQQTDPEIPNTIAETTGADIRAMTDEQFEQFERMGDRPLMPEDRRRHRVLLAARSRRPRVRDPRSEREILEAAGGQELEGEAMVEAALGDRRPAEGDRRVFEDSMRRAAEAQARSVERTQQAIRSDRVTVRPGSVTGPPRDPWRTMVESGFAAAATPASGEPAASPYLDPDDQEREELLRAGGRVVDRYSGAAVGGAGIHPDMRHGRV